MKKRIVSLLMALLMTLSLLPAAAWAEDADSTPTQVPETPVQTAPAEPAVPTEPTPAETAPTEPASAEFDEPKELISSEAPIAYSASPAASGPDSSNIDALLEAKGFTAPATAPRAYNGNFDPGIICYDIPNVQGTLTSVYSESDATLTITVKKSTLAAWQSLCEDRASTDLWESIYAHIYSYVPVGAVRGACALMQDSYVPTFLSDIEEKMLSADYTGYNGYSTFGRGFNLVMMSMSDNGAVELSANAGKYVSHYILVWDNDNDSSNGYSYKYHFTIILSVEEDFSYEWTTKSVTQRLRDAGYQIPVNTSKKKQFQIEMPAGLVEGQDYTLSYDKNTGHATIKLLSTYPEHWQQAFETVLCNCDDDFDSAADQFWISMGIIQNSDKYDALSYSIAPTDYSDDYSSAFGDAMTFAYGYNLNWYFKNDSMSITRPGGSWCFANINRDIDGNITISAPQKPQQFRCIALWAKFDKNWNISGSDKYMYTVSIEADSDFSITWNPKTLEERLTERGFGYPTMAADRDDADYGQFYLNMPKGLENGVDYQYTYDQSKGELTVTIKKGNDAHWKTAYLNSIIEGTDRDIVSFLIAFAPPADNSQGSQALDEYEILPFLRGEYGDMLQFGTLDSGYIGNDFAIASLSSSDSSVTISPVKSYSSHYAVVWKQPGGSYTKYQLKVTVNIQSSASHNVARAKVQNIDSERITVNTKGLAGGADKWSIYNQTGQLAFMPSSGRLADITPNQYNLITDFTITAPEGYRLESSYVRIFRDTHNAEDVTEPDEDGNITLSVYATDDFDGSTTTIVGGTLRYTLRWSSNDSSKPDLVEKLNVRIGDLPLGKTTTTGDSNKINITDMQNMYEYMTQEQKNTTDADSVDEKLATYDVNLDGSVNVYDFQRLYEAVSLNDGKLV